jgi:diacylglycerol kinase family enzyme
MAIVLNVRSGRRRRNAHGRLVGLLFDNGIRAQIFASANGAAVRAAAEQAAERGFEILVAAGGDGTAGTVAGVAAKAGKTLGVLPLGTFNHFARDLGISTDLAAAVASLRSTRTACVDLATVNGHSFVNTSGIGLYPRLVLEREHYRRSGVAWGLAFVSAAWNTLREFRPVNLRLNASGYKLAGYTPFVFVGNNPYALERGRLGARTALDRGVLWIATTFETNRWRFLKLAIEVALGRAGQRHDLHMITTDEVRVDSSHSRLFVSLDGEVEMLRTPLLYKVHRRALRVIVP